MAAAAILAIACVSTEASAYRGVGRAGGVGRVGGVGGVGRVGVVGGAAVAPRYYNSV